MLGICAVKGLIANSVDSAHQLRKPGERPDMPRPTHECILTEIQKGIT